MDIDQSSCNHSDERRQAFTSLLGKVDLRLQAFILSLVPHWADASEIAQEVRLSLWEQFDDYDTSKDFGAWACTIARYKVMAFHKDSSRGYAKMSSEFVEAIAVQAAQEDPREESRLAAMFQCLESLPAGQKELLVRHYSRGDRLKDIAVQLGESFDGLRQRLARIRRKLSQCIEHRLRSGEGGP